MTEILDKYDKKNKKRTIFKVRTNESIVDMDRNELLRENPRMLASFYIKICK
jgi:hypothetical protein